MGGLRDKIAERAGWLVASAYAVLRDKPLCDRCLGRLFGLLGKGVSNEERGRSLRLALVMTLHSLVRDGDEEAKKALVELAPRLCTVSRRLFRELGVECRSETCAICGGRLGELIERVAAISKAILEEYDASTFVVGVRLSGDIRRLEEEIVSKYSLPYAESVASEVKREVGKRLQALGFKVDFENPDVTLLVSYPDGTVTPVVNPMMFFGFYRKLARRISQSSWITRQGVKRYPFSVQDAYTPLQVALGGTSIVIHAAGREDVDVRMLGSGRPIVVEVKEPKRRRVEVKQLEKIVNEEWPGLFETSLEARVVRSFIRGLLKGDEGEERHSKVYRALVYVPDGVDPSDIKRLEEFFRNRVVRQRTPKRVRHRRADRIRERRVFRVAAAPLNHNMFVALIHAEGGLYIKELVSGEDTWPGFPDALGKQAVCVELDVLWVESRLRLKKGIIEEGAEEGEHGKAAQGLPASHAETAQEAYTREGRGPTVEPAHV